MIQNNKEKIEGINLWMVFFVAFPIHLVLTMVVYHIFNFDIALLFGISLATAMMLMGFTGVENMIKKIIK